MPQLLMSDLLKKPVDQVTDAERDQAKVSSIRHSDVHDRTNPKLNRIAAQGVTSHPNHAHSSFPHPGLSLAPFCVVCMQTVALGMLYGMGPAAAANRLNIPLSDAQARHTTRPCCTHHHP